MKKIIILIVLLSTLFLTSPLYAYTINKDDPIYVSGETIGIKIDTGVIVLGTYEISSGGKKYTPWKELGIGVGDKILMVDGKIINTIEEFQSFINKGNDSYLITYIHNGKTISKEVTPVLKDNDEYSLGIYVKDKVLGVGTLTYIIPKCNIYGALGHSIIKSEGECDGYITHANVINIKKATENNVGEKRAEIENEDIGDVEKNANTGIHGKIESIDDFENLKEYKIAKQDEVKKGKATILTTIDGKNIEEFEIEIVGLEHQDKKDIKGIKVKVTDKRLLEKTGGIIQGMSGSPIIQNDKIVGALTHVLVKNPECGYGIYIEWMLDEMDIEVE